MSDVFGDELPPSRVDIRKAMRTSRRRRRTRSAFAAASVVAVLGVGAATAPTWLAALPGLGGISTPGTASCPAAAPLPPLPSSATWEHFDPLTYEVDASELAGYQISRYDTSVFYQQVELVGPDPDYLVRVTLYAAGGQPHYRTTDGPAAPLDPATGAAAEPVNGTDAFWLPDQDLPAAHQGIAWQWVPGAWVFVTAGPADTNAPASMEPEELRGIAAQVAPLLRLGAGTPVTSPFALAVPGCTRPSSTSLIYGNRSDNTPFARFRLALSTEEAAPPRNPLLGSGSGVPAIVIAASSGTTSEDKPAPLSEVDGHEAHLGDCTAAATCEVGTVYDVNGFAIEIDGDLALGASVLDLLRAVTIYPDAGTVTSWGSPTK